MGNVIVMNHCHVLELAIQSSNQYILFCPTRQDCVYLIFDLIQIRGMKSLKTLCLDKNKISVIPPEILSCAEITELHLGNNR